MRVPVLLLVAATFAFGGFSSLKIMPGVREAAMGNVGVAAAHGAQGIAWNPAAVAGIEQFWVWASYTDWLLDVQQQSVFLGRNARHVHLGLGVSGLSAGAFEYRIDPTEEPLGEFVPADYSFWLTVARRFGSLAQAGITGRFYYAKVMEFEATGFGGDLGVRLMPVENLVVGASVVDFGESMTYYREKFRLPLRARLGATYRICPGERLAVALAGQGVYHIYAETFNANAGIELGYRELAFARAGYEWLGDRARPAAGFGLQLNWFRFDYAFTALNDDLGPAHRIAVGLGR